MRDEQRKGKKVFSSKYTGVYLSIKERGGLVKGNLENSYSIKNDMRKKACRTDES